MKNQSLHRSKKQLEKEGWKVGITEKWQSFFGRKSRKGTRGVRVDLFNLWDLVAVKPGEKGVTGVQCCLGNGDKAAHIKKMIANPVLKIWLDAGNPGIIHSWAKRGKAGKRKLWTCHITHLNHDELP